MFATCARRLVVLKIAVALTLMGASSVRAEEILPNCYVLSVGVDHYANPKLNLSGCLTDAKTATRSFRVQARGRFNEVHSHTLLDGQASKESVEKELDALSRRGKSGDFAVIFLSGHGSHDGNRWSFVSYDWNGNMDSGLDGKTLLDAADRMAAQGKKVIIIIDACFSGTLRHSGASILAHHRDPRGGGILLMLSSTKDQTSQALGRYSAYAQAVAEGMSGRADFNHDGYVTLAEVRHYAFNRVHQMLTQNNVHSHQDAESASSPSITGGLVLSRPNTAFASR